MEICLPTITTSNFWKFAFTLTQFCVIYLSLPPFSYLKIFYRFLFVHHRKPSSDFQIVLLLWFGIIKFIINSSYYICFFLPKKNKFSKSWTTLLEEFRHEKFKLWLLGSSNYHDFKQNINWWYILAVYQVGNKKLFPK